MTSSYLIKLSLEGHIKTRNVWGGLSTPLSPPSALNLCLMGTFSSDIWTGNHKIIIAIDLGSTYSGVSYAYLSPRGVSHPSLLFSLSYHRLERRDVLRVSLTGPAKGTALARFLLWSIMINITRYDIGHLSSSIYWQIGTSPSHMVPRHLVLPLKSQQMSTNGLW